MINCKLLFWLYAAAPSFSCVTAALVTHELTGSLVLTAVVGVLAVPITITVTVMLWADAWVRCREKGI